MFSLYSNVNNFHPTCFFSQLNWGVSVDCCAVWCTLGDLELTSVILKISVKKNIFLNMTDNPNELPQNEVLWQTICYIYIYFILTIRLSRWVPYHWNLSNRLLLLKYVIEWEMTGNIGMSWTAPEMRRVTLKAIWTYEMACVQIKQVVMIETKKHWTALI